VTWAAREDLVVRLVGALGALITVVGLIGGCGRAPVTSRAVDAATTVQNPGAGAQQLQFVAKTIDGKDFSGQSLAGKPAVLWFWAPWCPICQGEAPSVGRIAQANPAVTFVGVAAQDQVPAMRDFITKYQLGFFTHLADVDASVWRRFGVTAQPAFAFISAAGSVDVVKRDLAEQDLAQRVGTLGAS
jgi:thiol-disulfide isomerase/thioredoxin